MAYLVELRLNDNFLTGTLPSQFGKLTKLESITLDGNDLSGSAPNEVCGLNYLGVLDTFAVDCVNDRTGLGIICPSNTCCSFCRDNA